jgi:ADP-ribosylation factor GTPase-activating protein 1
MDAFKGGEMARMTAGGNAAWRSFFESHESTLTSWDDTSIKDRYDSAAGDEWKDRLTAKAEGKEYVPPTAEEKAARRKKPVVPAPASGRNSNATSRSQTPVGALGRKAQNEAYFAKLGQTNAERRDDVPPSQGGKFTGFGSDPMPSQGKREMEDATLPGFEELQKNPVDALTKGFGWFTSTVGKGAKAVEEGYVRPAAQKVCLFFLRGDGNEGVGYIVTKKTDNLLDC